MKIGLLNFEPNIINTAMMQVSQYHKLRGDDVVLYSPLYDDYDKIYGFSIFSWTDKSLSVKCQEVGGTGFDLVAKLPPQIEMVNYDYTIFPSCDYSIVWFSRGCIRNCPFCVVPEKEGKIHPVKPKSLNPRGTFIRVMDNNFFASPKWRDAIEQLKAWNQPVQFDGIDARLLNEEQCIALKSLRIKGQIHIAWDNPREDMRPHLKRALQWIKPYKLMCYVLVGFDSTREDDLYRIEELRKFKIDPYVMPYNPQDRYQRDLRRWCNRKALFKTCSFDEYDKRKG